MHLWHYTCEFVKETLQIWMIRDVVQRVFCVISEDLIKFHTMFRFCLEFLHKCFEEFSMKVLSGFLYVSFYVEHG